MFLSSPIRRPSLRDLILAALVLLLVAEHTQSAVRASAHDNTTDVRAPIASVFSFQGRLIEDGIPAHGAFDLEFALYAGAAGGPPIATLPAPLLSVPVANGLFNVQLEFGNVAFTGERRWLEVRAKPAGDPGPFNTFPDRQELTATPYALYAMTTNWAGILDKPANIGDITAVVAGTGLTGGATEGVASVAVTFAGTGAASTVARSDHEHYGATWLGSSSTRGLTVTNENAAVGSYGILGSTPGEFTAGVGGEAFQGGTGVIGTARLLLNGGDDRAIGVVGRVCGELPNGGCFFQDGGLNQRYSGVYGESVMGNGVSGLGNWDTGGSGVYGESNGTSGFNNVTAGVVGKSNKTGVIGRGDLIGVSGVASSIVGEPNFLPRAGVVGTNYGVSCSNINTLLSQYCVGVFGTATDGAATVGVYGQGMRVGVYGSAPSPGFAIFANGDTYSTGGYLPSDARLKTAPAESAGLSEILALQTHSYRWSSADRDDGKRHQGLYAQEVMEVLPDLVRLIDGPGEEHYALNYTELIPVLVRAIQEQQAQLDALSRGGAAVVPATPEGDASLGTASAALLGTLTLGGFAGSLALSNRRKSR